MIVPVSREHPVECIGDRIDRCRAHDGVHLGDLPLDLVLIALRETPGGDQRLDTAVFAQLCHLEQRIDALLLGIVYKAARVDDNRLRLRLIVRNRKSPLHQHPKHHFRIYQILVAAEGNK